jgi:hypothetical protein
MTLFGTSRIYNGSRYGKGNFSPEVPLDVSRFATISAETPATTVSSKYGFIPTTAPLAILADFGWFPVAAQEATTRVEAKQGFQRHMVRLAHEKFNREMSVGGTIPQLILTNDHSGGAAFEFLVGLFEKICANQLCVSRGDAGRIKVNHRGYADTLVEDSIKGIMADLPLVLDSVDRFKALPLTRPQEEAYAAAAIELRWDGDSFAVEPAEVLKRRHYEQKAPTLWNTYNAVQEAVIRGGVRQKNANGNRTRSRAVKSITEDVRLNRALWTLTEKMSAIVA